MAERLVTPTELLLAWGRGDGEAFNRLVSLVHHELRRMAQHVMAGERAERTLQPTALVNEAYLRLINISHVQWQDRAHFLAMAARSMRRIVIDAARSRRSEKRGQGLARVALDEEVLQVPTMSDADLAALDDALQSFEAVHPRQSQVVELRFFGGLDIAETAEVLRVSRDTVKRDWRFAKLWLRRELSNQSHAR